MLGTALRLALITLLVTSAARAQTHAIRGVVRDRTGTKQLFSGMRIVDVFANTCHPTNTLFLSTGPNGTISFDGPPSVYAIRFDVNDDGPREPIYVKVDTRTGPVTDLLIRGGTRTPYASERPPVAARISFSEPDANQIVTVHGEAGAVAPSSFVAVVTQETGHHALAEAAADGSFSTTIYAPRGYSLIVKHDSIGLAWQRVRAALCPEATALSAMAGTIVFGPPATSASGVPFSTGASMIPLPLYEFRGSIDRNTYAPGETVMIRGTLDVIARAIDTTSPLQTVVHTRLENVSAAGQVGARASNQFTSNLMTPTGFPIENQPVAIPGTATEIALTRMSAGRATASVNLALVLPATLAPGYYRPHVGFRGTIPLTVGEHDVYKTTETRRRGEAMLPIIRLGSPPAPRVPVALLMDHLSNATLGLRAIEDRDRFGVSSRIAMHADDFTVPRVDGITGQPIRYRLEPFLPSVMVGDRGVSVEPPLIPFRFPSGSLRVTITSPDGSTRTIGPAPFAQVSLAPLVNREGFLFDGGGPTEPMQLTTLDPGFAVGFERDGVHRVRVEMTIEDASGMTWNGDGTFDLRVGNALTLDTNMLPGTPLEVGDSLALGTTLIPPIPAEVEARVTLVPHSDRSRTRQWTRTGSANAFGYARLEPVKVDEPGEYRVDITAVHPGGTFSGACAWGSVVAPRNPPIVANGMRAIDDVPYETTRPQWFFRSALPSVKGPSHVPFPFRSGDVTWQERGDSALPIVTFQDTGGVVAATVAGNYPPFDFSSGEVPLTIVRTDGQDPHLDPSRIDLWLYAYTSVQRPLVRVREEIFDNPPAGGYWRFGEQYGAQPGVGRAGDATNDFKFQFGGIVMRGARFTTPLYAIYGSLFVLVPDQGDPGGGTRTFPPFQGNPGGANGGPLFKLKGKDVDLFLHPTGIRPGSILTPGETAAFAGHIAPPLDAKVNILVTAPSGATRTIAGQANRAGWFYDPTQDFMVSEAGVWRARVTVTFDGVTSSGQVQQPYPTGDVPGSRDGELWFYVVEPAAPALEVVTSQRYPERGPVSLTVRPPADLTNAELHYTTTMPGFVLEERRTTSLTYTFEAQKLERDFPNLDFDSNSTIADVITISLVLTGTDATGVRRHFARQVSIVHGEVLLSGARPAKRRAARQPR